jgi:hypothetical protein
MCLQASTVAQNDRNLQGQWQIVFQDGAQEGLFCRDSADMEAMLLLNGSGGSR